MGDVVRIELTIDPRGNDRRRVLHRRRLLHQPGGGLDAVERLRGQTVDEVKEFTAQDMLQLFVARLTPNRQKCCLLCWRVMQAAVYSPVGKVPACRGTISDTPPISGTSRRAERNGPERTGRVRQSPKNRISAAFLACLAQLAYLYPSLM